MIELSANTCFLVVSHSKNLDVLKGLDYNFKKVSFKISNAFLMMNDNSEIHGFEDYTLLRVKKSSWKNEMKQVINLLKDFGYERMIIWLDDFYLKKSPDINRLNSFVKSCYNKKYVLMRPQTNRIEIFKKAKKNLRISKIKDTFPYVSSLKSAIWDIDHFLKILNLSKNIWHFEKIKINNVDHYESTVNNFVYYHTVEKGKWKYYTPYLFKQEYLISKGKRDYEKNPIICLFIDILRFLKVKFFGYKINRF